MISRIVRQVRCNDVLHILARDGNCVFLTLTTPDVVSLREIRARWRGLRNWLVRCLGNPLYVMNFEKHPGYLQKCVNDDIGHVRIIRGNGVSHGWHIHAVFSRFIPLSELQDKIRSYGFGRLDVRRVTSKGVSDYLTKHALKAYRGLSRKERAEYPSGRLRLVNASRGLPPLSDYVWTSDHLDRQRSIMREYRKLCELSDRKSRGHIWLVRSSILSMCGYSSPYDWGRIVDSARLVQRQARGGNPCKRASAGNCACEDFTVWGGERAQLVANEPLVGVPAALVQEEFGFPIASSVNPDRVVVGDYDLESVRVRDKRGRAGP